MSVCPINTHEVQYLRGKKQHNADRIVHIQNKQQNIRRSGETDGRGDEHLSALGAQQSRNHKAKRYTGKFKPAAVTCVENVHHRECQIQRRFGAYESFYKKILHAMIIPCAPHIFNSCTCHRLILRRVIE